MKTHTRVSLVVDKDYGHRLQSLINGPVWIIDSPANRIAAEACRQKEGDVTTFKSLDGDSADAACLKILGTVDLHHGEHSGGYSAVEVVGTPLSKKLRSAIEELGFSKFESTAEGLRASR